MKNTFKRITTIIMAIAITVTLVNPMTTEAASKTKKPYLNKKSVILTITDKNKAPSVQLKIKNVSDKVAKKATWKSSNTKIATVNKSGKVIAKKKGNATITVKVNSTKLTCKVTIVDNRKPKKCTHKWAEHWAVFEDEGSCKRGTFVGCCHCGAFTSEEDYNLHWWMMFSYPNCTEMEKNAGIHGKKAKCTVSSHADKNKTYWKITTEYIDYYYCTKCKEKVTGI